MAYNLVTASYGAANANAVVRILETSTGKPAIILATETGGLVNDQGLTTLDASGNLSVYIDTARFWTYFINDLDRQNVYQDFSPKYVYAGNLSGAPAASGYTKGERILVADDSFTERVSNGTAWVGQTAAEIARVGGPPETLGSTRTLSYLDNQAVFSHGGNSTVTVPTGIGANGFNGCAIWLTSTGTITVNGATGVLINGVDAGSATLNVVFKCIVIQRVDTNSYAVL